MCVWVGGGPPVSGPDKESMESARNRSVSPGSYGLHWIAWQQSKSRVTWSHSLVHSFIDSFIYSFNKHLSSVYSLQDNEPSASEIIISNKKEEIKINNLKIQHVFLDPLEKWGHKAKGCPKNWRHGCRGSQISRAEIMGRHLCGTSARVEKLKL